MGDGSPHARGHWEGEGEVGDGRFGNRPYGLPGGGAVSGRGQV